MVIVAFPAKQGNEKGYNKTIKKGEKIKKF
jgi:hypothetical protein